MENLNARLERRSQRREKQQARLQQMRDQRRGGQKALAGPPENKAATPAVDATPAAAALADEHGIDLADVTGTGSGGRVTAGDVRALIED